MRPSVLQFTELRQSETSISPKLKIGSKLPPLNGYPPKLLRASSTIFVEASLDKSVQSAVERDAFRKPCYSRNSL